MYGPEELEDVGLIFYDLFTIFISSFRHCVVAARSIELETFALLLSGRRVAKLTRSTHITKVLTTRTNRRAHADNVRRRSKWHLSPLPSLVVFVVVLTFAALCILRKVNSSFGPRLALNL